MTHYIIVKWNNTADKHALSAEVRKLYADAASIPGIHAVTVKDNITPRDNRYDIMIALDMEEDALNTWDNSALHKKWKADYGTQIAQKCIFDGE